MSYDRYFYVEHTHNSCVFVLVDVYQTLLSRGTTTNIWQKRKKQQRSEKLLRKPRRRQSDAARKRSALSHIQEIPFGGFFVYTYFNIRPLKAGITAEKRVLWYYVLHKP